MEEFIYSFAQVKMMMVRPSSPPDSYTRAKTIATLARHLQGIERTQKYLQRWFVKTIAIPSQPSVACAQHVWHRGRSELHISGIRRGICAIVTRRVGRRRRLRHVVQRNVEVLVGTLVIALELLLHDAAELGLEDRPPRV